MHRDPQNQSSDSEVQKFSEKFRQMREYACHLWLTTLYVGNAEQVINCHLVKTKYIIKKLGFYIQIYFTSPYHQTGLFQTTVTTKTTTHQNGDTLKQLQNKIYCHSACI